MRSPYATNSRRNGSASRPKSSPPVRGSVGMLMTTRNPVAVMPRPLVDVALAAQRGQIQETVGAQHDIGTYTVGRIGVENLIVVLDEDTDALPVSTVDRHVVQPVALKRGLVLVVVLDRCYRLVAADMEVVVEVAAVRGVPGQLPAHARRELAQPPVRRT